MGADIRIHHLPELASWTVEARQLGWMAAGTSEWGTDRRHAGELLADALNSRVPQIFDTIKDGDSERRVLNVVDTEAAKTKLQKIKDEFQRWIWSDPDRTDRLARIDVPWLPSQIEQREGRIVRQGNQHDEVDIFAYATEGSLDAQMWQNNERKALFIAAALSGDTSIRRLEDLGEGQANQFAMAKAIASGDPRLMQKAGLEADIARLERLRAAHIDDQHAVRQQIRDAEREIDFADWRIREISQDIERLVPTAGEAFAMIVTGKRYGGRKEAGRALMKEILTLVQIQQEGESIIASIGGFDLDYCGERFGRDGYRYTTILARTGAAQEIDLPVTVTPLGAVARLEHALSGFEEEQERYWQRLAEVEATVADAADPWRQTEADQLAEEFAEIDAVLARSYRLLAGEAVPPKTAPQGDERLAVLYDLDWDEGARLAEWRQVLERTSELPTVLGAALALDAWADIEVLQRGGWIGGLLVAAFLRQEGIATNHLASLHVGVRKIPRERRRSHARTQRVLANIEAIREAAVAGLKEHDRLLLARERLERVLHGRRASSKLPGLMDLVLCRPMVSTSMVQAALKVSRQGALDLIGLFGLRELTGRGSYRAWGII